MIYVMPSSEAAAQSLIIAGLMGLYWSGSGRPYALVPEPEAPDKRDPESDEAPETPLDEPRPPRVQDPPPQPDQKGPYVVHAHCR
jgi:hypothetical protein